MTQIRQISDPDNSFGVSEFSKPVQSLRYCLLPFLHSLPRDFLIASLIPGLRSCSNAVAFFSSHLSGITPKRDGFAIISATPIGAWCYSHWWLTQWIRRFGLLKLKDNLFWYMDRKNPGRDDRNYSPGWSGNQNCEARMMERNPGEIRVTRKDPEALSLSKHNIIFEGLPGMIPGQNRTGFSSRMVANLFLERIYHSLDCMTQI